MTPMEAATHARMLAEAPPGDAFSRDPQSSWGRFLAPIAIEHRRIEEQADSLVLEVDPRIAPRLLDGYERVLGDDPCLGPSAELPIAVRQQLAHQRWTRRGVARPADFIALAAAVGVAITIEESTPFECGFGECGDGELMEQAAVFEWIVHLPASELIVDFELGVSELGEALGDWVSSPVECLIRARAPAHTAVYFVYPEP